MRHPTIVAFEQKMIPKKPMPRFRPGDTLRVHYKVEEATKTESGEKKFRIQTFEGVCSRFRKGHGGATFTIRKIGANSVGVERVFPLHSTYIDSVEFVSGGRVRRSRLYYLRNLSGKAARIKARRMTASELAETIVAQV